MSKSVLLRKVVTRTQLIQSIISFAFIYAAIFSTPSYSSSNYAVQLNLTDYNPVVDNVTVALADIGLSEVYRLGAFGYCNGSLSDSGDFQSDTCVNTKGEELDIPLFFSRFTDYDVPAPNIGNARKISKMLYNGLIVAASFSLALIIMDLANYLYIRNFVYTHRNMTLFLSLHVITIIFQIIVWTIMCVASTWERNLVITIEGTYDVMDTGITAKVGVLFIVLIRIAFSFGLVASFVKSMLLLSFLLRQRKSEKLDYETLRVGGVFVGG